MQYATHIRSARGLVLLFTLLFATVAIGAQNAPGMDTAPPPEPVTEEELESFAVAYGEIQTIQAELDERTSSALEQSDMESERFYTLNQMAQQSDPADGLPGVSDEELSEYQDVLADLIAIQDEMQGEMVTAVREKELSVERFNEIIVAIQQDPDLAERAQTYIEQQAN